MPKFLSLFLLFLLMLPLASQAKCNRDNNEPLSSSIIPLPTQILVSSKNYSPGEVLYDSGYIAGDDADVTIKNCSNGYYVGFHYNMGNLASATPVGDNVYPTNLAGIGIRTYTLNQAGPYDEERAIDNSWQPGNGKNDHTLRNSAYRMQLIATGGPIASGSLTLSGKLGTVDFREGPSTSDDGDNASEVFLSASSVQVVAMGCTADVASMDFPMGNIEVSAFDSNTYIEGPERSVNLSCQQGTNVNLTINGVVATGDNANGSVIALSDTGEGSVATGVGVLLSMYNPQSQAYTNLTLNQTVTIFASSRTGAAGWSTGMAADGSEIADRGSASIFTDAANQGGTASNETLTFKAGYYKTASQVTPGTANATGMITLQYN